jgi:hypothetical protein
MASKVCGLIEISGLSDVLPINPVSFKQISVQETLKIPSVKPDAEQIICAFVDIEIKNTSLINSFAGISAEGQKSTGKKLAVEGTILQKIEYVADEPTQSVHTVHFNMPFSIFIVMPLTFTSDTHVEVTSYIEDVFIQLIDKRTILKNVTILLEARF